MSDSARQLAADHHSQDAIDDAVLIARSRQRPECFSLLFDRHATALYRYVARRLGRDACDDLVAETFMVAFRRRNSYDAAHADARPWLYGIATRLISRHRRDEARHLRAIARIRVNPAPEPIEDAVTGRVTAQALRGELVSALARLPGAQRDVLLLAASGLSHDEIARALGVRPGTVGSRLSRGRRTLQQALGGANPARSREE
ncbi:MAG: RNA polymerase sigma factor [Streptosporangiaceae bacterium]|nr:RNA polymerase sigma factor [Streptosporangiaceae bacterium]